MKEITYNQLIHHTFQENREKIKSIYYKLIGSEKLSEDDIGKILSIVIIFSNQSDNRLKNLAYRMSLLYGLKTNDFVPMYDLAINTGLMPVVSLLKNVDGILGSNDSFFSNLMDGYVSSYKNNNITYTEQQLALNKFFQKNIDNPATIVAPTSYGKSELIISAISAAKYKNILIIVPSKSLLSQTRKRILDAKIEWVDRVISHPEMYQPIMENCVCVLTQERASRLLNKNKSLVFDITIVDEAHNILDKDGRNILLASVIKVLEYRNPKLSIKYLTPFLEHTESLDIKDSSIETKSFKVTESVKSESFYVADYRKGSNSSCYYDQYWDDFLIRNKNLGYLDYLKKNSSGKNIVYFNRPKNIQKFAWELSNSLPAIHSKEIDMAIREISASTHSEYLLISCMKYGVLYHHGSMTDAVRSYVEHLFRSCSDIKYLITSSTLLEGVNLPVERLFLFEIKKGLRKLTPSQFKNLIGRVNRFSEIFSDDSISSIQKLNPEVHIVGSDEYMSPNSNIRNFIREASYVRHDIKDKVENILLSDVLITDDNRKEYEMLISRLKNLESGINSDESLPSVHTKLGLLVLENNILEVDVYKNEYVMEDVLERIINSRGEINNSNYLMEVIYQVFVRFISEDHKDGKNSLLRLKSDKAQTFYAMFLDWNIENAPLSIMIRRFINYWDSLPENTPVFIGSWGDVKKEDSHREVFTYISKKSTKEKINLAIVRIKEEEDFFDYTIFRFVEILNDLGFISDEFYKMAKYGTTDKVKISMIQNGFSKGVAQLLRSSYSDYYEMKDDGLMVVKPDIHRKLEEDEVEFLIRNEVALNVAKGE